MNDNEPDVTVVPVRISDGTFPPRRPFVSPENRWATFGDGELITMEGAIREAMLIPGIAAESIDLLTPITDEIKAERQRRHGEVGVAIERRRPDA